MIPEEFVYWVLGMFVAALVIGAAFSVGFIVGGL